MPAALSRVFPHIHIYAVNTGDILMVASRSPIREPDFSRFPNSIVEQELRRLDTHNAEALRMRIVADKPLLDAFLWVQDSKPHSDFYPTVMLNAPRTRFKRSSALGLLAPVSAQVPLIDDLVTKRPFSFEGDLIVQGGNPRIENIAIARRLMALLQDGDSGAAESLIKIRDISGALTLKRLGGKPVATADAQAWQASMFQVVGALAGNERPERILAMLESDAIKPDLVASDPSIAPVHEVYRTVVSGDDAKILALPLQSFLATDSAFDPSVGDYLLTAQLLSAIKSDNAAAFERVLNISIQRIGTPALRQTRFLLHLYGHQKFKNIKIHGAA
jgi:spermidine synthase